MSILSDLLPYNGRIQANEIASSLYSIDIQPDVAPLALWAFLLVLLFEILNNSDFCMRSSHVFW